MKEKNIKIITLSDEKLQILSPPTSINQFNKNNPQTSNKDLNNNKPIQNKAGFTYFSKVEYLGSGGFSKVYKYRGDLENKAVKKIIADPKYYSKALTAEDSIKREVYGMTKVDCNHSLKVYGVYQNTSKNIFYILMEQCDGNIEKYMKDRGYPLNINELIILLSQLNDAFYLLDTNNIIHRDIKPSNILYKESKDINPHNKRMNKKIFEGKKFTFKLGDYGICIPLYDKDFSKSQFMGTLDYMAPEIYEMKCEKEHPVYTKKIDLFSLGQSICWLLGFFEKANAMTQNFVDELKKNCKLFSGNHKEKLLADLIFNHLLIFDPNKRDGWEEYLNHPLFEEYGVINNSNDDANYTDGNSQRIKKRVIKRNNFELNNKSKLYNSEKKLDISNKLNLEINKEQNNKININKNKISIYKYKINTNVERPFINSVCIKTNIGHKNTVVKNLRYMNDKIDKINTNLNESNKINIEEINSKIEKKKTFDYKNIKKLIDNKKTKNENAKMKNQLHIISNDYFTPKENNLGRYSTNSMSSKNFKHDGINSHFISIRNKYKNISQNKDKYNANKLLKKNIVIELNNKNETKKIIKQSSSFVKERKNKEEEIKINYNKDKNAKSHKKYNYLKNSSSGLIEKKNTQMKSARYEKTQNNKDKDKDNNMRLTTVNNSPLNIRKNSGIKVINYRIEENKKNKNIGFYFSKYSNATNKLKNNDSSKN